MTGFGWWGLVAGAVLLVMAALCFIAGVYRTGFGAHPPPDAMDLALLWGFRLAATGGAVLVAAAVLLWGLWFLGVVWELSHWEV